MTAVTYDDRSFMVGGQRVWLVSGSVHYFRVPAPLWRDRLLKAKRAGLNCISTYVAWNFHEPAEGQWRLTEDHDVVEFVRQAQELGLYVILRPGPYICAEWDFGGLPAWLTTKSGIGYRTNNAAYSHYFDKYFAKMLPPLAELQVTRGGNIILIQNENEYFSTTMPDRIQYLTFINQLFRRAGFDIPIINCNMFSDPPVPDSVECLNTWNQAVPFLKRMRLRMPSQPLLVTEFWAGWYDDWGGKHQTRDDRETARRAMEILGCGAQFNYYMWHGGTNFAFWGCRQGHSADEFQTTSYDYDAPLAEGGGLTPKYYLTKLVNMLANHMGPQLAGCAMDSPGLTVHDSTAVFNTHGPNGRWAVVTNNGRADITVAGVSLPDGRSLQVSLEPLGAVAVPIGAHLPEGRVLDYSNLMPLGLFGEKVLLLHGPAGFEGQVSIDGKALAAAVPDGSEPKIFEHQGMHVVLLNSDLAQRTWFVENTLVFGPLWVGQTLDETFHSPSASQYALLSMDGKLTHRKIKPSAERKPTPPRLSAWTRREVCTEPVSKDLQWIRLERPTDLDRLGVNYGYAWYHIQVDCPRARKRHLLLPDCADRATIYLNGSLLGVWGAGEDATRSPMPAAFRRGQNSIAILADNLGRAKIGPRLGELKGLFGHIYDVTPLHTGKFALKRLESFNRRLIPRPLTHLTSELEAMPAYSAELNIPLTKVTPLHMSMTGLPYHAAVTCNERLVGFFPRHGLNYIDLKLGPELRKGKNKIALTVWGQVEPKALDRIRFHVLCQNVSLEAGWSWRPWKLPTGEGMVVGKDQPAWYVANFSYEPRPVPLFLRILGARKGQIFLNGRNLGRFWNIGPQHCYYLPECWMSQNNELLIFEERGVIPSGSRLEYRPLGPHRD